MEMKHTIVQSGLIKTVVTSRVFFIEIANSWYFEDTDDLVANILAVWGNSDAGVFVSNKTIKPMTTYTSRNTVTNAIEIAVVATLEQKHLSEYLLKWGKDGSNAN